MRATAGDDFMGVQCVFAGSLRTGGTGSQRPGVPLTQMGYEYWPQGVEHCARRAAAITGMPVLLTESGIATDDDTERIDYISEVCAGSTLHSMTAWTYADISCGACSTTSSGHWVRAQVRAPQRRPEDVRPSPQAQRGVDRRCRPGQWVGAAAGLTAL